MAAGDRHTVVCTEGGQVSTFGWGENGQLGHGGQGNELVPRVVEGLTEQVKTGWDFSQRDVQGVAV